MSVLLVLSALKFNGPHTEPRSTEPEAKTSRQIRETVNNTTLATDSIQSSDATRQPFLQHPD